MNNKDISLVSEINLEDQVSPAILAGILGISVPMIYQGRQEGKLPADTRASYRTCIQHYIQWHKKRSNAKASNMLEKKVIQEIRNLVAKEEMQWLEIKKTRNELVEKAEFAEIIQPIFQLVRQGLVNLSREMPETTEKVDSILRTWATLGDRLVAEAQIDADRFVHDQLVKEVSLEDDSEELKDG